VAGDSDGYRLTLRKPFHPLREQFYGRIRQARLSQAAIDVLAIVAYQQPLSAEQIGAVRGKPSGPVLTQLVHRGLLRIERPPGKRPSARYFTTDRFLQLFGLQTLADLPQSEELDRQ
jgi:segregation and condensation protein B